MFLSLTRRIAVVAALCLTGVSGLASAQNQTSTLSPVVLNGGLPYSISLRVRDMGGSAQMPTLQSFSMGVSNGLWVLVAGRTNGLHNFSNDGFNNFPPAYQNTFIWLIDPVGKETWSRSLEDPSAGLSPAQVTALSATNTEGAQVGDTLYVAGGYVYDRAIDNFTTYNTLTALDLPGVIAWVKGGAGTLVEHVRQTSDPALKVAGGELRMINGRALLVFGQDFEGPYTTGSNGNYTQQVRAFDIVDNGTTLSIANLTSSTPAPEYRRRDLNVVPMMQSNGVGFAEGLIALSGVFLPGATGGAWTVPVEIDATGAPSMADPSLPGTFKQGMNNYSSATISMYSERRDETHTIALGGISLEYYDTATGTIAYDAGIPFINGITSIVRTAAASYSQYYLGSYPTIPNPSNGNAPFLFGAEAKFVPAAGIETYPNGMLKLDTLQPSTVIGYVYGGIIAAQPNFGSTGASNIIFDVVYTPPPTPTPAPEPQVAVQGKSHRDTSSSRYVVKGTASGAVAVRWRLSGKGKKFRQVAVAGDGQWKIKLSKLKVGKNTLRVRALASTGSVSSDRKITIVRKATGS